MSVVIAAIRLRCTQGNYMVISSIVYYDMYDCVHHPQPRMSKQESSPTYEVALMQLLVFANPDKQRTKQRPVITRYRRHSNYANSVSKFKVSN